jgi:multidrug efflux pump subunit AcrA (membrane-fusion protein)
MSAMIDNRPLPHVEQRARPRTQKEKGAAVGTTVAILAACLVLAIVAIYIAKSINSQNAALAETKALLARSVLRADDIQAKLDTAKVQSTALQVQLAGDQGQRLDLQSKLDQATALFAALQAQVASDKSQQTVLQAQLDQAKAQLDRATRESAAIRVQLDQARSQAADEQAQLAKAQRVLTKVQPLIVEARKLPLVTAFEKSFWDQGFTLHINNSGASPINLRIRITGAEAPRAEMTVIDAGATVNVERLHPGEIVALSSDGFDPISLTAR